MRHARRWRLQRWVVDNQNKGIDDVNVIIVARNRFDYRLKNALRSLRDQSYPQDLIHITLVDYDSDPDLVELYLDLCESFSVNLLRAEKTEIWCKSHALNIAIKKTKQKYILSSDVDVIFEKHYIQEAIQDLKRNPFQVILADLLELPKIELNEIDFAKMRALSKPRYGSSNYIVSMPFALTCLFQYVRGYDEFYKLWGKEDDDLLKRFNMIGMDKKRLSKSFHLHQWHPKHEGIDEVSFKKQLEINTRYLETSHTVVRNPDDWGNSQSCSILYSHDDSISL